MSDEALATGGCLCGAVRFRVTGPGITTRQCWCRDCQYTAAGSATNNVFLKAALVAWDGEIRWYDNVAASGNGLSRAFCPTCGTPLFLQSHVQRHLIGIRLGAFDDTGWLPPQSAIWTAAAPAWACIDPALPAVERQP